MALSEAQRKRNQVATLSRYHPDSPQLTAARRELAAVKLADYISRTVEAAPPLTSQQRERLSAMFRPTPTTGDAA